MKELVSRFEKSFSDSPVKAAMENARRIVVAFSGGADSSLLLRLTCEAFIKRGVRVEAAHLNHMIRGAEADRDEAFCVSLAEEMGVVLHTKRVDIPALTEKGGSVEDVARRERYAFFEELTCGCDLKTVVFTAHNADDNMETVLFNMLRGAGARGMCGIPPVRDGKYIRPLLGFTSSEIRKACGDYGVPYVNDSTNFETDYTRNYIRANVSPMLSQIVPNPQNSVMRMTRSLRCDDECLSLAAEDFLKDKNMSSVENRALVALHDAVLSRVLIKMYTHFTAENPKRPHPERRHIEEIISHLRDAGGSFSVSVPGNAVFTTDGRTSFFAKRGIGEVSDVDRSSTDLIPEVPVRKNGFTVLLTSDINGILRENNENIYNLSIYKGVKFDKIKGKLKVRTRMDGDTYYFGGMRRRVKKLYSDRKLPRRLREALPVIYDDSGIAWIPGFPLRDDLRGEDISNIYNLIAYTDQEEYKNEV